MILTNRRFLTHSFLKPKHTVRKLFIDLFSHLRVIGVGMMAVKELHDMETTSVDVEVDISLLKVRRYGLPDLHFRMQTFDSTPCGISDAPAVDLRRNKEDLQITVITLYADDHSADRLSVLHDAVSLAAIDGLFNRLT